MKESFHCGLLGSMGNATTGEMIVIRGTAGSAIALSW